MTQYEVDLGLAQAYINAEEFEIEDNGVLVFYGNSGPVAAFPSDTWRSVKQVDEVSAKLNAVNPSAQRIGEKHDSR
jgi:hypothetical protein